MIITYAVVMVFWMFVGTEGQLVTQPYQPTGVTMTFDSKSLCEEFVKDLNDSNAALEEAVVDKPALRVFSNKYRQAICVGFIVGEPT